MANKKQLTPTGTCWCGCEQPTKAGAFFLTGHDKTAESAVIQVEYGSVAAFIVQHRYGPDGRNPRQALAMHKTKKIASWAKGKG
jgi:hypothetical protein